MPDSDRPSMGLQFSSEDEAHIFFEQIRAYIKLWSEIPGMPVHAKCEGVVFSLPTLLDGASIGMPAYELRVRTDCRAEEADMRAGKRWHQDGIALPFGTLHELWTFGAQEAEDENQDDCE